MLDWIRKGFVRFMGFILALHGIFHVIEFGSAMFEEAYITATLAALGATSMLYATYFMEGHIHHHGHHYSEDENQ